MGKETWGFYIILIISFALSRFVGETILDHDRLRINPALKERLVKSFTSVPVSPSQIPKINIIESPPIITTTKMPSSAETLALCLTDRGFSMYGTKSCPSCALQRRYFGGEFSKISYIDCDEQHELCQSKSISAYPTWESKDGKRYKGAIPLETLARLSGCEVSLP